MQRVVGEIVDLLRRVVAEAPAQFTRFDGVADGKESTVIGAHLPGPNALAPRHRLGSDVRPACRHARVDHILNAVDHHPAGARPVGVEKKIRGGHCRAHRFDEADVLPFERRIRMAC